MSPMGRSSRRRRRSRTRSRRATSVSRVALVGDSFRIAAPNASRAITLLTQAATGMAVVEHLLIGLGYAPTSASRSLVKLSDAGAADGSATVAEEVPIALVYNG